MVIECLLFIMIRSCTGRLGFRLGGRGTEARHGPLRGEVQVPRRPANRHGQSRVTCTSWYISHLLLILISKFQFQRSPFWSSSISPVHSNDSLFPIVFSKLFILLFSNSFLCSSDDVSGHFAAESIVAFADAFCTVPLHIPRKLKEDDHYF